MAQLKRRFQLTLDIEIEIDDVTQIPLSRDNWRNTIPGEFIVARMATVKQVYRKVIDTPEVLDAFLRQNLVQGLSEGFTPEIIDQVAQQLGVEQDCEKVVAPVLEQLEGVAARHLEEAEKHDMVIEALDLFWGAFRERLVGTRLEEVEE